MGECILTRRAGKSLPTLSKPANAAQILKGYQAINQLGEILTGAHEGVEYATVTIPRLRPGESATVSISPSFSKVGKLHWYGYSVDSTNMVFDSYVYVTTNEGTFARVESIMSSMYEFEVGTSSMFVTNHSTYETHYGYKLLVLNVL